LFVGGVGKFGKKAALGAALGPKSGGKAERAGVRAAPVAAFWVVKLV
jgi:hypothetical protein